MIENLGGRNVRTIGRAGIVVAALLIAGGPVVDLNGVDDGAARAAPSLAATPYELDTSSGAFLAARHAESLNDLNRAADFIVEALKFDPGNQELRRRAILLLASAGRIGEAVPIAADTDKSDIVASFVLIAEAARTGDFKPGIARAEALPKDGIGGLMGPLLLAWLRFEDSGPDAALGALKTLGESRPARPIERLHAGFIYDLAGRADEARESYLAAIGAGQHPPFRFVEALASFYQRNGNQQAARDTVKPLIAENPESSLIQSLLARLDSPTAYGRLVTNGRDGIAESFFDIGSGVFRQSEALMALLFGQLALHARPEFPVNMMFVAETLESMKHFERAIALYRQVPAASPFYWEAQLRVANDLNDLKRVDEALALLRAMAKERPDGYEAHFRLGNLLREHERYPEAIEAYDRAFERAESARQTNWALYYARGMALERAHRFERAESDLLRALELRPEQPFILNYLAYMWIDQGVNLDRAREMIKRAVELRPDDGYIVDSLGWFYYRTGEFEQAVNHLERAVELRPVDPVINDHLGDAYWQIGRKVEAQFQWRRALTLDATPDLVTAIKEKLDRGLSSGPAAKSG
jgi:tetratricopeptide (TPR) repeat protein